MGRVSRFTYFTLESRIIRLEDLSEKKASKSSKTESSWWVFAQLLRMIGQFVMRSAQDPNYIPWVQNMIDLDIRLREIVQREEFLISQCEKAEKLLDGSTKEQQQLDEWHTELQNLERSYWTAERMLCANDRLCPDGPSWRAYLSLRKSPQWYLSPWLIDDCERRGGCCGRACGCCLKPRSSLRSNGHGHCTKTCGCCLQARGFSLDEEQEKLCQPAISVKRGLSSSRGYDYKLVMSYTFGVVNSGKRT